jgi:hypothetical protein
MKSNNDKAPHILNTSSTLFGLCFVVFTSLKTLKISSTTYIDEFTAVAMLLFMTSCLCSFLSIRNNNNQATRFEQIADYTFLSGLLVLFLITVFIVFNIIS